jgi:hypothetical protein
MERKIIFVNRYGVIRLYFAGAGVQLRDIRLTYELDLEHAGDRSEYIYG